MQRLYRGEPLPRLNQNELQTGEVQPQSTTLYRLSNTTREDLRIGERQKWFSSPIESLPGGYNIEEQHMTPGFTGSIGAAVFFSWYNMEEPGLVFEFDQSKLPDMTEVEYDISFMQDHPGILGRVETLADSEIWFDDELIGLAKDGDVRTWGDIDQRANSKTYEDETEWFTYETGVSLLESLEGVYSFVGQSTSTNGALETHLAYFDGYTKAYASGNERATAYMETEEKVEAYHQELSQAMNMLGEQLVVVLVEDQWDIQKGSKEYDVGDTFVTAYDGTGFVPSPI